LSDWSRFRNGRSSVRYTPWKSPQTTKVHAAPCQRPPRKNVRIRFALQRAGPQREPPSGM
jgi:hypothetical protein